eukprot:2316247-Amphidinium_carterae.1
MKARKSIIQKCLPVLAPCASCETAMEASRFFLVESPEGWIGRTACQHHMPVRADELQDDMQTK